MASRSWPHTVEDTKAEIHKLVRYGHVRSTLTHAQSFTSTLGYVVTQTEICFLLVASETH